MSKFVNVILTARQEKNQVQLPAVSKFFAGK